MASLEYCHNLIFLKVSFLVFLPKSTCLMNIINIKMIVVLKCFIDTVNNYRLIRHGN